MEQYSKKQSVISHIRNYLASAAILAGSIIPSYAQDAPKAETKPVVESKKAESVTIDSKVEEFKLPFSSSPIFLPQRLDSTYLGAGSGSGQGDNDSSRSLFEGNLRLEDFTQIPVGLYVLSESGKKTLMSVAPEDTEQYAFDSFSNGTADIERNSKSSYILFGGNAFGAMAQFTHSKETADKRYRLFEILVDDPGTPLLQTTTTDLDSTIETSIEAVRLGYTYAPVSVMVGAFKRKSESIYATSGVAELSGLINFQSTETLNRLSETELKGYLFALEAKVLPQLMVGTEVWLASGDSTFSESTFSNVMGPDVSTFVSGTDDIGYKQFAFNVRGTYGPFIGSLQVGKRQNDGSIDDQTFYSTIAGAKLGPFLLNGVFGKDAQIGNTFVGGNVIIGGYALEDLSELNEFSREVVGMTFNGDPTYSGAQGIASRVRHVERIASKPGVLLGAYNWENAAEKNLLLADIAANFGYGVMLQLAGTIISDDDTVSATAYLHWNMKDIGVPLMLTGFYDYAKTTGLDTETGVGAMIVGDLGAIVRRLSGK